MTELPQSTVDRLNAIISEASALLENMPSTGYSFVPFNGTLIQFLQDNLKPEVLEGYRVVGNYVFINSPFAWLCGIPEDNPSFAINSTTGMWFDNSMSGGDFLQNHTAYKKKIGSLSVLMGFFSKDFEPVLDQHTGLFRPNKTALFQAEKAIATNYVLGGKLLDMEETYNKYRTNFKFMLTREALSTRKELWSSKFEEFLRLENIGYSPELNALLFFGRVNVSGKENVAYSRRIKVYPLVPKLDEKGKKIRNYYSSPEELAGIDFSSETEEKKDKYIKHPLGTFVTCSPDNILSKVGTSHRLALVEGESDAITVCLYDRNITYAINHKDISRGGNVVQQDTFGYQFVKKTLPQEVFIIADTGAESATSLFALSFASMFYRVQTYFSAIKEWHFADKSKWTPSNTDISECIADRLRNNLSVELSFLAPELIDAAVVANRVDGLIPLGIHSVQLQGQRRALVRKVGKENLKSSLFDKALECFKGLKKYTFTPTSAVIFEGAFGGKSGMVENSLYEIGLSCLPGDEWLEKNPNACSMCQVSKIREELDMDDFLLSTRTRGEILAGLDLALPANSPAHTQVKILFESKNSVVKHQQRVLTNLGVLCAEEAGGIKKKTCVDTFFFNILIPTKDPKNPYEEVGVKAFVDPSYEESFYAEGVHPSSIQNDEVIITGYPVYFEDPNIAYLCIVDIQKKVHSEVIAAETLALAEREPSLANLGSVKKFSDKKFAYPSLTKELYNDLTNDVYRFIGYYFPEVMMNAYLVAALSGREIAKSDGRTIYSGQTFVIYGDPSSGKTYVGEMFLRLFNEQNQGIPLSGQLSQSVVSSDVPASTWRPSGTSSTGVMNPLEYVLPIKNDRSFLVVDEINPNGVKMNPTQYSELTWDGKASVAGIFNRSQDSNETNKSRCPLVFLANTNAAQGAVLEASTGENTFIPYRRIPGLRGLFLSPFFKSFGDNGTAPMILKRTLFLVTPGYYGNISRARYSSRLDTRNPPALRGSDETPLADVKERSRLLKGISHFMSWVRSIKHLEITPEGEETVKKLAESLSGRDIIPDSGIYEQFADVDGNERKILSFAVTATLLRGATEITSNDIEVGYSLLLETALYCAGVRSSREVILDCYKNGYFSDDFTSIQDTELKLLGIPDLPYTGIVEDLVYKCVTEDQLQTIVSILARASRTTVGIGRATRFVIVRGDVERLFEIQNVLCPEKTKVFSTVSLGIAGQVGMSAFAKKTGQETLPFGLFGNESFTRNAKYIGVEVDSTFFTNSGDSLLAAIRAKVGTLMQEERARELIKITEAIIERSAKWS
jgi:hypothetical protein